MSKMDKRENIILIASEPLTFEKGEYYSRSPYAIVSHADTSAADWMEIRTNHMVVVTPKMNLLQVPIIDKYYVQPSDPEYGGRGVDFAAAKGLLSPRRDVTPVAPDPIPTEKLSSVDSL